MSAALSSSLRSAGSSSSQRLLVSKSLPSLARLSRLSRLSHSSPIHSSTTLLRPSYVIFRCCLITVHWAFNYKITAFLTLPPSSFRSLSSELVAFTLPGIHLGTLVSTPRTDADLYDTAALQHPLPLRLRLHTHPPPHLSTSAFTQSFRRLRPHSRPIAIEGPLLKADAPSDTARTEGTTCADTLTLAQRSLPAHSMSLGESFCQPMSSQSITTSLWRSTSRSLHSMALS